MKFCISVFVSYLCKLANASDGRRARNLKCIPGLGLGIVMVTTTGVSIAQVQVAPQFRTAPRSLITEKVDRNSVAPIVGATRAENILPDLGSTNSFVRIEHMQFVLKRPAERQAAFDAQVEAMHIPGSSSFHRWLTPDVGGAEFGPSASDVATIKAYLESEGFSVNFIGRSLMFIDFSGTAAQVERSFHTSIHNFQMGQGDVRYAAVREAQLPTALIPAVAGILPISSIPAAKPMMHRKTPSVADIVRSSKGPQPDNTVSVNNEYDEGPQDFYTIYNENPLLSASINGAGTTVALIEQTDLKNLSDVTAFRTNFNVVPNAPNLTVMHGAGAVTCADPGVTSTDEEGEAMLDTEWAGAVAPSATLLYMSCGGTGIFASAQAIIDNNLADTMSLSYGYYEAGSASEDTMAQQLWELAASQGETVVVSAGDSGSDARDQNATRATHGTNVSGFSSTNWNVSAGGTDFQDGFNYFETQENGTSTAYGFSNYWSGTNATGLSSALKYVPEIPWNQTCAGSQIAYYLTTIDFVNNGTPAASASPSAGCDSSNGPNVEATGGAGGGPSSLTANARASWQKGTVYGIPSTTTYPNRLQPDISFMAAAGFWGHGVDYYQTDVTPAGLQVAGGTSFVAPQLAGLFALITQKTGERVGQANYVLYALAAQAYGSASGTYTGSACGAGATSSSDTTDVNAPASTCVFHDIQWGNNSQACTGNVNCYKDKGTLGILSSDTPVGPDPAWNAGNGYDMATGLGSVNIANLVNAWPLPANLYTPTVALTIASASVTTYGTADNLTATVSGPGSLPTGSVTFTATPTVGSVGVATILGTAPCSTGGTCVEQATQSIYPAIPASNTPYNITAKYSSTNENYVSGVTSSPVTITIVNKQTPTTAVQNVTAAASSSYATLTATITYTGVGAPPSGGMNFSLPGGSMLNGTCAGTTSPLACSVNYPISSATYPVGTYTISASYPGDSNYNAVGTKTATLTINNGTAPTITFTTTSPQYTMYPTVTLTSTSNSTGAKTYSVSGTTGTAAATISGSTLTLTGGSGTITVLLSQAAAGAYLAGSKSSAFTVNAGSIWVADSTNDISTFDQSTGTAVTASPGLSGGGVGTIPFPQAEAFDAAGDLWIASSNGISEFTPSAAGPVAVSSTPYTVGGISTSAPPVAVAVDGLGVIWVANYNGTISALSNAGAAISPSTGYTASGVNAKYGNVGGIAIDLSGSVWVTNTADGSVTQVLGVAAPVAPIATSLTNGTTGVQP